MKQRSKEEAGRMFKDTRESKGLLLEDLAKLTDDAITAKQIDMYENGEGTLSVIGFILMCKALEIEDPDEILYEEI